MLAGLAAPDPPLSDGVVTLRVPDVERDAPTAASFRTDPEVVRFIFGAKPPKPTDPATAICAQLELWRNGTDAVFSIDAAGHDARVGVARVMFAFVALFGFAEIGYILLPDGRGRGYATRAVRLLAQWVFDDLQIGRLQARTAVENIPSQRVLERVGFTREGIARSGSLLPVSGDRIDCVMWSLLPGELL